MARTRKSVTVTPSESKSLGISPGQWELRNVGKNRVWTNLSTDETIARRQGDKKIGLLKQQGFSGFEQKRDIRKEAGIEKGKRSIDFQFQRFNNRGTEYIIHKNVNPTGDTKRILDNPPKRAYAVSIYINMPPNVENGRQFAVVPVDLKASRTMLKKEVQDVLNRYKIREQIKEQKLKMVPSSLGYVPEGTTFDIRFVLNPEPKRTKK